MPLLSRSDLERMERSVNKCLVCEQEIKEDYCRQDDEFFERGHAQGCGMDGFESKHYMHRSYRETTPPYNIKKLEFWEVVQD